MIRFTLTEEQARSVELGLEVLMRAQLDQFGIIKELVPPKNRLDCDLHNILSAVRFSRFASSGRVCYGCVDESHINLSKKNDVTVEWSDDGENWRDILRNGSDVGFRRASPCEDKVVPDSSEDNRQHRF